MNRSRRFKATEPALSALSLKYVFFYVIDTTKEAVESWERAVQIYANDFTSCQSERGRSCKKPFSFDQTFKTNDKT